MWTLKHCIKYYINCIQMTAYYLDPLALLLCSFVRQVCHVFILKQVAGLGKVGA